MNILESIKIAFSSMKANKMRAFLTMLGIIIGISSVIAIVSLGSGGKNAITSEFEKLGASSVSISVDTLKAQETDYITLNDIEQIKEKIDTVKYASPSLQTQGKVFTEDKAKTAIIMGGSPDSAYINNSEIEYGRFYNEREYEKGTAVGIIDKEAAVELFGYEDVVGETLQIGKGTVNKKITIIGVEKGFATPFGGGANSGRPIFVNVPITFIEKLQSTPINISSITIMSDTQEDNESAGNAVVNILEIRHNNRGKDIYSADNAFKMLEQIDSVLGIFTSFIGAVAAISLLVGGIGVMNIMLVSVTERTKEIGIRKAIGATTHTILMQFLIESIIISLMGGIIGMVLGIIGAEIIGNLAGITPSVSLTSIVGTIIFSSAVGIFFGIYPARKAAKLDPIDALRYE